MNLPSLLKESGYKRVIDISRVVGLFAIASLFLTSCQASHASPNLINVNCTDGVKFGQTTIADIQQNVPYPIINSSFGEQTFSGELQVQMINEALVVKKTGGILGQGTVISTTALSNGIAFDDFAIWAPARFTATLQTVATGEQNLNIAVSCK